LTERGEGGLELVGFHQSLLNFFAYGIALSSNNANPTTFYCVEVLDKYANSDAAITFVA